MSTDWRNLITESEQVNPLELTPHPRNFYTHPMQQRKVVNAAIAEIGYVDEIVVNRRTNRIVNGHLRVELAIGNGEATVPVAWIDCDEETETRILLFFDRIGELAKVEGERVKKLVAAVAPETEALQDMLDEWCATFETFSRAKPAPVAVVSGPPPAPAVVAAVVTAAPGSVAAAPGSVTVVGTPTGDAPAVAVDAVAPVVAGEVAALADEAVPATVATAEGEATGTVEPAQTAPPAAAPAAGGVDAPAVEVPVLVVPEPADHFEAAIVADGGDALPPPPAPSTGAKIAKPPVVRVTVGEYDQDIPEALFNPWWNQLVADVGTDYTLLVAEVRRRLQLPDDPR